MKIQITQTTFTNGSLLVISIVFMFIIRPTGLTLDYYVNTLLYFAHGIMKAVYH